jgi:ADP-ribose pyrophosphatase YjhB (NUDIX family)
MKEQPHPRQNDSGQPVILRAPSTPSNLAAWADPSKTAIVVPEGPMPEAVNGVPFAPWESPPVRPAQWNSVVAKSVIDEPHFECPAGKKAAAGIVIEEADGRIWLVAPSNAFGGYTVTFPKGHVESGISRQASAIKEVFEECGLRVQILGFLADSTRSQTHTRYYVGRRVGGTPSDMGWESQAVLLAPLAALDGLLNSANDGPLIDALKRRRTAAK